MVRNHALAVGCSVALAMSFVAAPSTQAQTISLDDNMAVALPAGAFGGAGAEDEFGIGGGPVFTPSPTGLGLVSPGVLGTPSFDGVALDVGAGLEHTPGAPGLIGASMDAFSMNKAMPQYLNAPRIFLDFSVDRVTGGIAGSASATEAGFAQQAGDIYSAGGTFINPSAFAGTLTPGLGYGGALITAGSLAGTPNFLLIDESGLGLTTAAGVVGPGVPAGPYTTASHDNVDAWDGGAFQFPQVAPSPPAGLGGIAGVYGTSTYFTVNPDEASLLPPGASAADIFVTPPTAPSAVAAPFAPAMFSGLDSVTGAGPNTDSIDALVMFDLGVEGQVDPGVDFALFSLAPGSLSLTAGVWGALAPAGLSAGDVFFTDFSGTFMLYAADPDLGLSFLGTPGGSPYEGVNVDALDIFPVPEPASLALLGVGVTALIRRRR